MRTKFSKRILSLLLAVVTFATTIPAITMTANADIHSANDNKYVFAYFTGDEEGQKIRLALSSDGHSFAPLNGNNPYLSSTASGAIYPTGNGRTSSVYPACGYARDPFIIEKVDGNGYWIVATDLKVEKDANGNDLKNTYNNSKLLVWDVKELSSASSVQPWNIEMCRMYKTDYTNNASTIMWAPEVVYDHSRSQYMLFWSGPVYGSTAIQCCWTNDFQTFYNKSGAVIDGTNNEPEVLYSYSGQVATNGTTVAMQPIDADIVYNNDDSTYYMVIKNELGSDNPNTGELFILKSKTLEGFNNMAPTKININGTDSQGRRLIFEGPELYQRNDGRWVLITDQYSANPLWDYYMIVVNDINDLFDTSVNFLTQRDQSTNINDCLPRHGAVATITSDEYYALAQTNSIPQGFPYNGNDTEAIFDNQYSTSGCSWVYNNVLYSGNANGSTESSVTGSRYNSHIRYPETTMLYDGVTTPTAGAMILSYRTNASSKRYFYGAVLGSVDNLSNRSNSTTNAFVTDGQLGLVTCDSKNDLQWRGKATNWDFPWAITSGGDRVPASITAPYNTSSELVRSGRTNQNNGFTNMFGYVGGDFESGQYLKTEYLVVTAAFGSTDTRDSADLFSTHFGKMPVYIINYKPIRDKATDIINKFNEVMSSDLSTYCPEALDAYLAAVAKVTSDINVYFENANHYQQAANHIEDIVENGLLELALKGPVKSRIQYGNIFDFDAYVASGSTKVIRDGRTYTETVDGKHVTYHQNDKIVTIEVGNDSYTPMTLKNDTYTIPVEPGQKYIFEFTSDSPYGDAMLFIPNADHTSYNTSYTSWRPHGEGVQKVEVTIPTVDQVDYEVNYVWFRLGTRIMSTDPAPLASGATANISRIRFYKAQYENWASRDIDTLAHSTPILDNSFDTQKGAYDANKTDKLIGFTHYGEALAVPADFDGKHFCGWYADEALTKSVNESTDVSGCAVLYAKYSDTDKVAGQTGSCLVDNITDGEVCSICGKTKIDQVTTTAPGHNFKYDSKIAGTDNYEFICTADHNHTNELTDASAYEYAEMIKGTLDPDRYNKPEQLRAGIAEFEAMKTNLVNTKTDEDVANGQAIQAMIDEATRSLLNAINGSEYSTYNLEFNVYKNGVLVNHEVTNKQYNDVVTVDASSYIDGGVCQAWTVQTADSTNSIKAIGMKNPSNTYDVRLVNNTIVNAYYVDDTQQKVVTLTDQYGSTLYQFTADSITINGNTITANGTDYNIPDMPYMAVKGFTINGKTVDGTVSITESVKVRPKWDAVGGAYAFTLDNVALEGTYKYDELVKVTAPADAYAVAVKVAENDYRVAAYGNEYSFYACANLDFYTVTKDAAGAYTVDGHTYSMTDTDKDVKLFVHKLNYKLPFVYSVAKNSDAALNRYTAFTSFTVGADVQIIEAGTLFYKGIGANVPGELTIDNDAISDSAAKNIITLGNQYSLSAKGAIGSATGLTTRAYVKFSYNYGGTTVEAVEYGNVCSTETLVD